jgi:hypothetical protein
MPYRFWGLLDSCLAALETLRTSDVQFGEEPREQEEEVPHAGTTGTNHPKALNTVHKGKKSKA